MNEFKSTVLIQVGAVVSTIPSFWALGSNLPARWGLLVWSLLVACSPRGSVGFFPQSKDTQVRWIVNSKSPICVNVSVNGRLSLYPSPVTDWRPVLGVSRLSPNVSCDTQEEAGSGWMDVHIHTTIAQLGYSTHLHHCYTLDCTYLHFWCTSASILKCYCLFVFILNTFLPFLIMSHFCLPVYLFNPLKSNFPMHVNQSGQQFKNCVDSIWILN